VELRPWVDADLRLLQRINVPEIRNQVGGVETSEQLTVRHERYLRMRDAGEGWMFSISIEEVEEPVGTVGFWQRLWRGEPILEIGWNVVPARQGGGVGSAAVAAAIVMCRTTQDRDWLYAFPSVSNTASNALCRRAGFSLQGECDYEYPAGRWMRSSEWRLRLRRPTA
jgi:RimJ/RimL family protein N-acetyltransferase